MLEELMSGRLAACTGILKERFSEEKIE